MEPSPPATLPPWYVTGFSEGEATFTYSRNGAQLSLYFGIKLPATDRPILEDIREFFGGIGRIYELPSRPAPYSRGGLTRATVYYRVCRRDQLPRIVLHFDQFPLVGSRARSFAIWREMVLLKEAGFRRPDLERLSSLAAQLSAASSRSGPIA